MISSKNPHDAKNILEKIFGYKTFRKGQDEIITAILNGRDALGIMPTGAGKSLCYQIPALCFDGVSVVISPLISLMKDQVDALRENGVNARTINSMSEWEDVLEAMDSVRRGECKILYVAPERLETAGFLNFLNEIKISFLVVDEAHCISQWGHDFRPSYLKIAPVVASLRKRPIVGAFTATATEEVREDIVARLELRDALVLTTGFDRENLFFQVERPFDKNVKRAAILKYIKDARDNAGIVYCGTRRETDELCEALRTEGIKAVRYHAGLSDEARRKNQDTFLFDRASVMVATNAFGMGIDKSNVRYVLHNNMPKSLDSYYQEAGRAGRDGASADCVLFYSPRDVALAKYFIAQAEDEALKASDMRKLNEIIAYCNTSRCLRAHILNYFGETDAPADCANCSSCNGDVEKIDVTIDAKKILSCIYRMQERTNGTKFGTVLTIDVLRGSGSESVSRWGFETISTFGLLKNHSKKELNEIIAFLVADGYIAVSDEMKYPTIDFTQKTRPFLRGTDVLLMRKTVAERAERAERKRKITKEAMDEHDEELFDILRALRKSIAQEEGVPPYIVFSDAALIAICKIRPHTDDEFLSVSGVGATKLERYGEKFMNAVARFSPR